MDNIDVLEIITKYLYQEDLINLSLANKDYNKLINNNCKRLTKLTIDRYETFIIDKTTYNIKLTLKDNKYHSYNDQPSITILSESSNIFIHHDNGCIKCCRMISLMDNSKFIILEMTLTKYLTYPDDGIMLQFVSNEIENDNDEFTLVVIYKKNNITRIIRSLVTIDYIDKIMNYEYIIGSNLSPDAPDAKIYKNMLNGFLELYGHILLKT